MTKFIFTFNFNRVVFESYMTSKLGLRMVQIQLGDKFDRYINLQIKVD